MPSKPKAAVEITETPLSDYLYEVGVIADAVLEAQGCSRDRALIRQAVEKHITAQQAAAKKRSKKFEPLDRARFDQVARALAIGVTKTLEAWEYVEINQAWPPEPA